MYVCIYLVIIYQLYAMCMGTKARRPAGVICIAKDHCFPL